MATVKQAYCPFFFDSLIVEARAGGLASPGGHAANVGRRGCLAACLCGGFPDGALPVCVRDLWPAITRLGAVL